MLNVFLFQLFGEIVMNHATKLLSSCMEKYANKVKKKRIHPHLNDAMCGKGCALHSIQLIKIKPNEALCSACHSEAAQIAGHVFTAESTRALSGSIWGEDILFYFSCLASALYDNTNIWFDNFTEVKTMCVAFLCVCESVMSSVGGNALQSNA